MREMSELDEFDKKILVALQVNCQLTNSELGKTVNLSPSQCSRRRSRLEDDGVITGYTATLDRERIGLGLLNLVFVSLANHTCDNAAEFAKLVARLPEVLEAHALTGETDYVLKIVTRDLRGLSNLVNEQLLVHPVVQHVRTAVVLETLKDTNVLPL